MARYKHTDAEDGQGMFLSVNLKEQLLPGSFEYMLDELIGGKTFAVDGLRLPSNASLDLTGTAEELEKRLKVYRRMAEKHIEKHQRKDAAGEAGKETERRYQEQQKKLNRGIEKISTFLEAMEKKESKRGKEIKSNVTDNESAMIHTPHGYIQGYIGMAVSDQKEQIIVSAQAAGSANECEHFPRILGKALDNM